MMISFLLAAALPIVTPVAPNGKWVVEYDKDMCVLSRAYGAGNDALTVALRPYPMSTRTEIVLISSGSTSEVTGGEAEVTLLPAEHSVTGTYSTYKVPKSRERLATLSLDAAALDGVTTSSAITIRLGRTERHTVAIPGIASGMRALEACQTDLLRGWGIDPAERAEVVTPPMGNPGALFGPDEYPKDALRAEQQGRTISVLLLDNAGTVKTCVVVSTSGSQSLDQATCHLLQGRGHFLPGRNKDGQPVPAHVVVPVRWVLP